MATKESTESGWTEATNGADANSDGWTTVSEEVQIAFENEGDGFIGVYASRDTVGQNGMVQFHFENVTDLDGNFIADRAFVNGTRDLVGKLRTVPFRRTVRATWTKSMDTGQATPMRIFSVQWK
jgi:hypothetical protein